MAISIHRVVTGHDAAGRSVILSDGPPPQHHGMAARGTGAEFIEMWSVADPVPALAAAEPREPNEREFTIMPASGHLLRMLRVMPLSAGGQRTIMHRTSTLDYVVMIEGELTLILDDSERILKPGDVVVQRATNHAWENRSDAPALAAFFHIEATFTTALVDTLPKPLQLMR